MKKLTVNRKAFQRFLGALLPALLLAGCGGGGGGDEGMGTVGVSLTDAPACGYDEVNVTVRQVRIHRSSAVPDTAEGWADINLNPPRKINLLDLNNGVLESLGQTPLSAGQYTQVRLVLVPNSGAPLANSVVLSSAPGVEVAVQTPSAVQSGIKLVHAFNVRGNERTDLVLDFDACKSIVLRGNGTYLLKPVIKVLPEVVNGIRGVIAPALLASNVVVSAQQNGEIVRSTVPGSPSGEFFLSRLDIGTYDLVVTADGRATSIITTVPVSNSSFIAVVSTSGQPLNPPASTTHILSGTVTLNPVSADTPAFVTAKQTVSGSAVTVKFTGAGIGGAYSLTLPADAPLIGPYGTGAPISLTPVPAAAGQYAIETSAEGFTTQTVAKDLSTADATENFTLVP